MSGDHAQTARALLRSRRRRDEIFGADRDGFGEPAWDMLLALFIDDLGAGAGLTIAALASAQNVPGDLIPTYAQWMRSKLLAEVDDGVVRLTERGRLLMVQVLESETT